MKKKKIIEVRLAVFRDENNRRTLSYQSEEESDSNMTDIGLLIYKMKQVEQELLDRDWNNEEGYEIEEE